MRSSLPVFWIEALQVVIAEQTLFAQSTAGVAPELLDPPPPQPVATSAIVAASAPSPSSLPLTDMDAVSTLATARVKEIPRSGRGVGGLRRPLRGERGPPS